MYHSLFQHHFESLLRFWTASRDPGGNGYHHNRDWKGTVLPGPQRNLLIHSRLLYMYAEGVRLGHGFAREHADNLHGFLVGHMRDEDGGYGTLDGTEWRTPGILSTYDNLFVVIGLARYAEATGSEEARAEAWRLLEMIETRCAPEGVEKGLRGYAGTDTPPPGSRLGFFTGNINLHYLEALCCLQRAGGGEIGCRLQKIRSFFQTWILDDSRWITHEDFGESYAHPHVEPGAASSLAHALEWVDFFREAGSPLDPETEQGLMHKGLEHGVDTDGFFRDAFYLHEGRAAGAASFWTQVEAAKTFNRASEFDPQGLWADAAKRVTDYYFRHFVDPEGGVFSRVDRTGVVTSRYKGYKWKCDYHSVRLCVDALERGGGALFDG
ncbi:MAG: AGE family epimerase/isomerase [Verrucomicrobia bacterium]|nr:AGE family epimerase/isomerase [Verrucomicrobiota bacterium]MCH8514553.1 AGE family epimerase/isomerase [Kiritimatiellia bacterium]